MQGPDILINIVVLSELKAAPMILLLPLQWDPHQLYVKKVCLVFPAYQLV